MKRLICLASALVVMALTAVAGAEDTPSIKEIMGKLHKGANAPLAKLKTALKSDSPDWKEVQGLSKDFVVLVPHCESGMARKLERTYLA